VTPGEYRTHRVSAGRADHAGAEERKAAQNNSNRGKDGPRRGAQYDRKKDLMVGLAAESIS